MKGWSSRESAPTGLNVDLLFPFSRLCTLKRVRNVVHIIDQLDVLTDLLIVKIDSIILPILRVSHPTVLFPLRSKNHFGHSIQRRILLEAAIFSVVRLTLAEVFVLMDWCSTFSLFSQPAE